ncbi:MAG: 1,4-dihydroxy-2-naphthoate polyprenyltransferase [Candidatus Kapabacteria bacterium]|jgi:1,4-dihydroxy-2-naphthoate octaprenyltransferase|nr:1,4-dihydroxy-2-naphthoate polyprenyltransferase [Candidatus Kapabacteria bacterium]
MNPWFLAIRPKTLPAGAAPVLLGMALAFADGVFAPLPALAALICAVLMQIASNLINDVYDFRNGADTAERLGPPRAVASGLLSEEAVKRGAWIAAILAFCLGQYLVWVGGWQIFAIGVIALITAWAYTGGPLPLAYIGLGEVCAFVFFGVVSVCGTYYVQSGVWSAKAFVFSLVPAFWSANILLVNNIRDIPTDSAVGKNTLAVRIGSRAARLLYCVALVLAFCVPIMYAVWRSEWWLLLSLGALPLAVKAYRSVIKFEGRTMNDVLLQTVRLLIVHTALISCALLAGRMM